MLPAMDTMTPITQDQLLADFEAIIDRVVAGEYFLLSGGVACVLMPYTDDSKMLIEAGTAPP